MLYAGFGYDPFYFHMFSLLLHIGCVCLVWKLISSLLRVHGGVSEKQILYVNFITTLLFAVHPINVEAVAWISALKVLLYAFFYLLGLLCYLRYIRTSKYFLLCINDRVSFFVCFLGKGTGCYFSLALLIVDWFTNRNMKNLEVWSEKMSFSHYGILLELLLFFLKGKGLMK